MTKLNLVRIAVAALLFCTFTACNKKTLAPTQRPTPTVEVAYPIKKQLEFWDEFTAAYLDSEYSVDVQAKVGGYLQSIHFKDGDFVKKGDLLFVIDPRPYMAALEAAKASVLQAQARLSLAKDNAARSEELFASKAISKEVHETRKSELLTSEAALLNAKANLTDAELNLEFAQIRAPISGYVSERKVDAGNLIPNGVSPVLATIVSKDIIYVYFEVSERDVVLYMESGSKNFFSFEKGKGPEVKLNMRGSSKEYSGRVTYVDPRLDKDSASLMLRAEIDNKDGLLLPGMYADTLKMRIGEPKEYMLLPEAVINTDMLDRFVVVVDKDGNVKYTPVKVGRLVNNTLRVIESGINADDLILIKGAFRALPNSKVNTKIITLE